MKTFGILMIWAGVKSDSRKNRKVELWKNFYRHLFRNKKTPIFGVVGIGVGEIFEYNFWKLEFFGVHCSIMLA